MAPQVSSTAQDLVYTQGFKPADNDYDADKVSVLQWLQTKYDAVTNKFPEDLLAEMKAWCEEEPDRKKTTKTTMQFGAFMKAEALERGVDALDTEPPFDQAAIMEENRPFIVNSLEVASFELVNISCGGAIPGDKKAYSGCVPGKPTCLMYNIKAGDK